MDYGIMNQQVLSRNDASRQVNIYARRPGNAKFHCASDLNRQICIKYNVPHFARDTKSELEVFVVVSEVIPFLLANVLGQFRVM